MFSSHESTRLTADTEFPQKEDQELSQEFTVRAQELAQNENLEVSVFPSPVPVNEVASHTKNVIDVLPSLPGLDEDSRVWTEETLALLGVYACAPRLRYTDTQKGVSYPQDKLLSAERAGAGQRDLPNVLTMALRKARETHLLSIAENDAYQKKLLLNHFSEYMGPQRLRESLLPVWPEETQGEVAQAIDTLENCLYGCVHSKERNETTWSQAYSALEPAERDEYVRQLQLGIGEFFDQLDAARDVA